MENNMQTVSLANASIEARQKFMTGVYGWMVAALAISAAAAYLTIVTEFYVTVFTSFAGYGYLILIIAELGLVMYLVSQIRKLSVAQASFFFILYSVLNGVTLSSVLLVYTRSSIAQVFLITALMFGGMSLYGMKTKSDLMSAGRYFTMALIGLIIASVVNILLKSSGLSWIISIATVVIFTGLTAYDTQKLMRISVRADGSENFQKIAIIGALELYLDFINIFLALLRLFGNRR